MRHKTAKERDKGWCLEHVARIPTRGRRELSWLAVVPSQQRLRSARECVLTHKRGSISLSLIPGLPLSQSTRSATRKLQKRHRQNEKKKVPKLRLIVTRPVVKTARRREEGRRRRQLLVKLVWQLPR